MKRTITIFLLMLMGWFRMAAAENIHFSIAPNPANAVAELVVDDLAAGSVRVEVYTVLGTLVSSAEFRADKGYNAFTVNVSTLPEGVYLIRITQNDQAAVKRLKVQHSS